MKKRRVLLITNHRKDRSPGQRFRFEQYLDALEQDGCVMDFSFLLNKQDDIYFYSKGNYFRKAFILAKTFAKRFFQIFTIGRYDIVFIYREAYFTGTSFFEKAYRTFSKAKFIFDFDDAIWMEAESVANKKFNWLKNPGKTKDIIALCDLILTGNTFLKEYALQYNNTVMIIPTTVDTKKFSRTQEPKDSKKICIGWSGSFSTIEHFKTALPALKSIKEKYGDRVYFKVIGDANYKNNELGIQGLAWTSKDEVYQLSEIDIGIMPLPDDNWSKGKCGLKGLSYMSLSIPTIMSPVGVNTDIIQDGNNGFLAANDKEWIEKLSILIDNKALREKIGIEGQKTVEDKFSIIANTENYLQAFRIE